MKATLRLWTVALVIGLFLTIGFTTAQAAYRTIDTTQLTKMMASPNKPLLAFSLSPIEYGAGHIPNSDCIPYELVKNYYGMPARRDAPIVFYCHGPG